MSEQHEPLLTSRRFVEYIEATHGIPVPLSRLHKDMMVGKAPKPAAVYGKRHLFTREQADLYAAGLIVRVAA